MAGVKYEFKTHFNQGAVYVLLNDDWDIDVLGEEEIDSNLVSTDYWMVI